MDTRRQSHERRSSRRSLRNSLGSSIDTNRSELSLGTAEKKLQKILDAEEHELIVYFVREELLSNAINQCYDRYIEKQCVDFTVHCAYRALKQFVDLGCFMHDPGKPFYLEHPAWLPDNAPITSPPDTWAAHRIAIKEKRKLPLPRIRQSELDELREVKFGSELTDSARDSFKKDEGVEILYEAQLNKGNRSVVEYDSEIGLIGPPASIASSFYGEDFLVDMVEEEEDENAAKRPSLPENWSFFTRITKVPPEDLPGSLKSIEVPFKANKGKVTEPAAVSLDELSEKPHLSVGVLAPLRSEIHCSKTKLQQENKEEEGKEEQKISTIAKKKSE